MPLNNITQSTDQLSSIPPREELDIYSYGHHVMAFSKTEWNFVVKILKEENDPLLLRRHEEALDHLKGLVPDFQILKDHGKVLVIQEKIHCLLDEKLRQKVSEGNLIEAKKLVEDYIDLNTKLWSRGYFDWHFRINHCGVDSEGRLLLFDIGGIRGNPTFRERIKWIFGFFGRRHKKNKEILQNIHPELSVLYNRLADKKLTRHSAEETLFNYYLNKKL